MPATIGGKWEAFRERWKLVKGILCIFPDRPMVTPVLSSEVIPESQDPDTVLTHLGFALKQDKMFSNAIN